MIDTILIGTLFAILFFMALGAHGRYVEACKDDEVGRWLIRHQEEERKRKEKENQ